MLNEEEITELDNTINTEIDEEEIEEIAEDVAVKEKIDIDNTVKKQKLKKCQKVSQDMLVHLA